MAIKELPDYQTHVLDKPLELLIKVEALMHTPQKAIYPPLTLVEILLNMLQVRQKDNEDLVTYLSRFKSERNIMFNLFGKNILDGYVEKTPEYTAAATAGLADEMTRLKERALDQFLAVLFLRNSDQERYGGMMLNYRLAYAN